MLLHKQSVSMPLVLCATVEVTQASTLHEYAAQINQTAEITRSVVQ
jgi:hypothetical protein